MANWFRKFSDVWHLRLKTQDPLICSYNEVCFFFFFFIFDFFFFKLEHPWDCSGHQGHAHPQSIQVPEGRGGQAPVRPLPSLQRWSWTVCSGKLSVAHLTPLSSLSLACVLPCETNFYVYGTGKFLNCIYATKNFHAVRKQKWGNKW